MQTILPLITVPVDDAQQTVAWAWQSRRLTEGVRLDLADFTFTRIGNFRSIVGLFSRGLYGRWTNRFPSMAYLSRWLIPRLTFWNPQAKSDVTPGFMTAHSPMPSPFHVKRLRETGVFTINGNGRKARQHRHP